MSALRLRLPDAPGDDGAPIAWARHDRRAGLRDTGVAAPAELPAVRGATLVLPAARVTAVTAVLPPVRGAKLDALLPYLVEDAVADDPAELLVVPVRPRPGAPTPLLVVGRAWLEGWIGVLRARRIVPGAAVPEWLCLPHEADTWSVAAVDGGWILRTGEVSGAALDGPGDTMPPAGLVLALEASRREGTAPRQLQVCHAADGARGELPDWEASLGLPVVEGPPWDWRTAPLEGQGNILARHVAASASRAGWRAVRPGLAAGAAALAVHAAACGADWAVRTQERDRLRAEMHELYRRAVPEARHIVDPSVQLARKVEEARRASGHVAPDDFLALIGALAQSGTRIPPGAIRSLRYREGILELDMAGPRPDEVRAWAAGLAGRGLAGSRAESATDGVRLVVTRYRA